MNTANIIYNSLRKKGYTVEGICGILGNLAAESALRPDNLEDYYAGKNGLTDAAYVKGVDNGSINFILPWGFGLAQWTAPDRKKKLLQFALQRNTSIADLQMQIDFLDKELREDFPGVFKTVHGTDSVKAASDAMLLQFERPANATAQMTQRYNMSNSYYRLYKNADADTDSCDDTQLRDDPDDNGVDYSILPVLSRKKNGAADNAYVSVMQALLYKTGYAIDITDRFDSDTEVCLKAFQSEHDLDADGICGRMTWAELVRCET